MERPVKWNYSSRILHITPAESFPVTQTFPGTRLLYFSHTFADEIIEEPSYFVRTPRDGFRTTTLRRRMASGTLPWHYFVIFMRAQLIDFALV